MIIVQNRLVCTGIECVMSDLTHLTQLLYRQKISIHVISRAAIGAEIKSSSTTILFSKWLPISINKVIFIFQQQSERYVLSCRLEPVLIPVINNPK